MNIEFDPEFSSKVTGYRTVTFSADVENSETSEQQISEMNALADSFASRYKVSEINSIPAIAATRAAYKKCGKDPNRYRPSQEQLMRRIVRGLGLYYVNAIVDAGNMLSLQTGCSVGCFDADKIVGETLTLGIGRADEPYEGIGRGKLNIEGLPVFRDALGGVGTPTSDNERTKLSLDTQRLFVTVHLFDPAINSDEVQSLFQEIFTKYAAAVNIKCAIYSIE